MRLVAIPILVLLLHSATAAANCTRPEWKDPVSQIPLTGQPSVDYLFSFQSRAQEFIVCQRNSLEKRASGLAPADVQQLILKDRAAEERVLVETEQLSGCQSVARREKDAAVVRKKCEGYLQDALAARRPPYSSDFKELESEQRRAYGGAWSYRTLRLGQPGACMDGPCEHQFAVEITNMTPVVLKCEVALTVSNSQDRSHRGEQSFSLNPGHSLPVARAQIYRYPEKIEPEVNCSPARPLAAEARVPATCVLNWPPLAFAFPGRRSDSWWEIGMVLAEIVAPERSKPAQSIRILYADSPYLSSSAERLIEKVPLYTNCVGQRFRLRVEYRAFPCFSCWTNSGVVTVFRDDRGLP